MATKCITVTEDAYGRLTAAKKSYESFSDIIVRSFPKRSLSEFAGCISKKTADELTESVKELRKRFTESHRRRVDAIVKQLEGSA